MGCHTWCYKKIDVSIADATIDVLKRIEATLDFADKMVNNRQSIAELLEDFPECTVEYGKRCIAIAERQKRLVINGFCKEAVMHKYSGPYTLTKYVPSKGMYVCTDDMPHDIFRKYGYPTDRLFSLQETLDYINNPDNNCHVHDKTVELVTDFWSKYPDGMICFG